jgi:hypothetical protein
MCSWYLCTCQALVDHTEAESQKTEIALRFVEWFTDRGVMYEQNMKTIDKHLYKLATANLPQHRNPYENPVRISSFTGPTSTDDHPDRQKA